VSAENKKPRNAFVIFVWFANNVLISSFCALCGFAHCGIVVQCALARWSNSLKKY
jgi:hypothetical protein